MADEIFKQTALSVENYVVCLDTHCLRHTINQHGSESEKLRGQVPVRKAEVRLLLNVFEHADTVSIRRKSAIGNDCLIIEKIIGNLYFFSVWEIRKITSLKKNKNSKIVLQTFYIRKTKKPF